MSDERDEKNEATAGESSGDARRDEGDGGTPGGADGGETGIENAEGHLDSTDEGRHGPGGYGGDEQG